MSELNWFDRAVATEAGFRLYQQEKTILDVTESICGLMESQGVTRAELAQRLGVSKARVTQLLSGERNMTLRTMSDVFLALNRGMCVTHVALEKGTNQFDESTSLTWNDLHDHSWEMVVAMHPTEPGRFSSNASLELAG